MRQILIVKYVGYGDENGRAGFVHGNKYEIEVKQSFFGRRLTAYAVGGFTHRQIVGTEMYFDNLYYLLQAFQVVGTEKL